MRQFAPFFVACAGLLASGCVTTPPAIAPVVTTASHDAQPSKNDVRMRAWLDRKFQAAVAARDIPSLTVGVIRDGEILGTLTYGKQRRDGDASVDARSIYQIASLSKMFTGLMTHHLVRNGTLDPDQPIATYLADVITDDTAGNLQGVTLDQLLHHHAGIVDKDCSLYRDRVDGEPWLKGYSRAELIADINRIRLKDDAKPPFHYTSCGYAIVGLIDELVTGEDYASLLQQLVAARYDMPDTVVALDTAQQARLVTPYRKTDRSRTTRPSLMGMGTPASAIYSDVTDLLNLQRRHIAAYRTFLENGTTDDLIMTDPVWPGPSDKLGWGAHLLVLQHPSGKLYMNDGDADGFASFYVFSPENNLGLVLLTSSGGRWFGDLSIEAITGLMDRAYLE